MRSTTDQNDDKDILEPPQRQIQDYAHGAGKILLAAVPGVGGAAAELFSFIITPPIEKRRDEWIHGIIDKLRILEQQFESFRIEQVSENATLVTTLLNASRAAIMTHQREKHEALQNAVLNAALPSAPDEVRQQLFVRWIDEFTPWHLEILTLFETSRELPPIDLDDPQWPMNIALDRLAELIEESYPETEGRHAVYVQIVRDLHDKGLIANLHPSKDMATKILESPRPTKIAKEFLKFIASPIHES